MLLKRSLLFLLGLLLIHAASHGQDSTHDTEIVKNPHIKVSVGKQKLWLLDQEDTLAHYQVSTSKVGIGNKSGSMRTPLGKHYVIKKIGDGAPLGTIFESRNNTGKKATIYKSATDLKTDHVTTRILRLAGLEEGVNKGNGIDSFDRYIYIHGTPEEGLIGQPASHGCIRMKNEDVVELFNKVPEKILVDIVRE